MADTARVGSNPRSILLFLAALAALIALAEYSPNAWLVTVIVVAVGYVAYRIWQRRTGRT